MIRVARYFQDGKYHCVDVSNDTQLYEVACKVLKKKMRQGYFPAPEEIPEPGFGLKDINQTKSEPIKRLARNALNEYNARVKDYKEKRDYYVKMQTAVDMGDGESCLKFMEENKAREGMLFEIYELEGT